MGKSLIASRPFPLFVASLLGASQVAAAPSAMLADRALSALRGGEASQARTLVMEITGADSSTSPRDLEVLADEFAVAGMRDQAVTLLTKAVSTARGSRGTAETLVRLGTKLGRLNARTPAIKVLSNGISLLPGPSAVALTELGDLLLETGDHSGAAATYEEALSASPANGARRADLLVKALKASSLGGATGAEMQGLVERFRREVMPMADDPDTAVLLLDAAAVVLGSGVERDPSVVEPWLERSLDIAAKSGDRRIEAEALALEAKLAEIGGRYTRALRLTRQSLLIVGDDSIHAAKYRLYWQIGRLLGLQEDRDGAIDNYERAQLALTDIRSDLLKQSQLVLRERVLPLYREYLELLLGKAEMADGPAKQTVLAKVQSTLEAMNTSEVLDYFDDDCLLPSNGMALDAIPEGMAVVYQIILTDRLVSLVRTGRGLHQFTSIIATSKLRRTVEEFRDLLISADDDYLDYAEELYGHLIAPVEEALAENRVDTLVMVPTSYLRLIPVSALHDNKQFMIERFRIATTLGLQLTDDAPFTVTSGQAYVGGVADAVQDFPALPGVVDELNNLEETLGATPVLNEEFSVENVSREMSAGNYRIVHLATHGVFSRDHADSYLLAHDSKISLDRLQSTVGARRFTGNPLDLLVLSACETARGDEWEALGLAGVTLKAGARSTIATLWPVADETTSDLMQRFYAGLMDGKGKAEALRQAQLTLLADAAFGHPNYWSPFLLIGNWQ